MDAVEEIQHRKHRKRLPSPGPHREPLKEQPINVVHLHHTPEETQLQEQKDSDLQKLASSMSDRTAFIPSRFFETIR